MTLRFIEGFDHYASVDLFRKWDTVQNAPTIVSGASPTTRWSIGGALSKANNNQGLFRRVPLSTTYVVGFAYFTNGVANEVLTFMDGATVQCYVSPNADGSVRFNRGTGPLIGTSGPSLIPSNRWCYMELKAVASTTVGIVEMRIDGLTVFTVTGQNTAQSGQPRIDGIYLGTHPGSGSAGQAVRIDDVYMLDNAGPVNTDYLGDLRAATLLPTGPAADPAGHQQWDRVGAATNFQAVNEAAADGDTSYVQTNVTNEIDSYAFADLPVNVAQIHGVQFNLWSRRDDAGARNLDVVQRLGGTDSFATAGAPGSDYRDLTILREQSLATPANAWTVTEINNSEFGVRLGP